MSLFQVHNLSLFTAEVPSGIPSNIRYNILNSSTVLLQWNEVECSKRNGLITGYIVQYTEENANHTRNITGGNASSHVLTGLIVHRNYSIRLAAANKVGVGPFASIEIIRSTS